MIPQAYKRIVIMGFGGHARSVADVALACGYTELIFVDENARPGEHFLNHVAVNSLDELEDLGCDAFAASGDAMKRRQQCVALEAAGFFLVSLIAPSATIGIGSSIAPGCFVGHHAHIGPMASIGKSCIINTGAIVEHESCVGDYSHVSINASVAGRSKLGAYSMLGAGAVIIDRLSIADGVTIGAGGVVISSIELPGTYIGVPVRQIN